MLVLTSIDPRDWKAMVAGQASLRELDTQEGVLGVEFTGPNKTMFTRELRKTIH